MSRQNFREQKNSAGIDQMLVFFQYLRGKRLVISPADSVSALRVLDLLGYQHKTRLRDGLASTLAKSEADLEIFEEAFNIFFKRPFGPESGLKSDSKGAPNSNPLCPDSGVAASDPFSALRNNALFNALDQNDESHLALSIEVAAKNAKVGNIKMFTQRGQYVRSILDALGDRELAQAAIRFEDTDHESLQKIQALREQLREKVRDRVERAYVIQASALTEELLDDALSKLKLGNIAPNQMVRLKRLIERMTRKLIAKHGRRKKKGKRGLLHFSRTVRESIQTDCVPLYPQWRTKERKRPQVMAICDVSGSVSAYAKFLLMFIYALQDVLPRTRSFAFSAALGEVSDLFTTLPVEIAIEKVNLKYGGATDYARALEDFNSLALREVNASTTVIILGDARNNNAMLPLQTISQIKAQCGQLIWLNPESRNLWGTGDSEMLTVKKHCHIAAECNNLIQLQRIIDKLLLGIR